MPAITASLFAACLLLGPPAQAGEAVAARNLLRNGDFEAGSPELPESWQKGWLGPGASEAGITRDRDAAHAGRAGLALSPRQDERWDAVVQPVDAAPRTATMAHLAGWVRLDGPAGAARASLTLSFPSPGVPGRAGPPLVYRSRELLGPCDWTLLELDAPVPPGCTGWTVGCAARGAARASFDELLLTAAETPTDLVGTTLAVARGNYSIEALQGACDEPWVEFSIPLPIGGQTPLALRVVSEPPDAVASLRLVPDRENRPLRVQCRPVHPGDVLKLTAETLVLLHDRPLGDLAAARLPAAQKVPAALKPHLLPAPGLRPGDKEMRDAADRLSHDNLGALFTDLRSFLEYKLAHSGDGQDHAIRELQHTMSGGARWANLAASLLMASGVPTRLLACTGVDGALQEHYILEAWTEKLGWTRLDPTGVFPWGDTRNIVLRVVYPDSPRTQDEVPAFVNAAKCIFGAPDMNPLTLDWQSAETLGSFALPRAELAGLEAAARTAYEGLAKEAASGARMIWVPAPGKASEAEATQRLREAVAARVDG